MDTHCYLYAITRADCRMPPLGLGVDPRFRVEAVPCGPLAALASRVDLDRFDLAKLEEGTTDVAWLSEVAVRHDWIVREAMRSGPLLPMRLGTVFHSRHSMLAKLVRHEAEVAGFLRWLGDRREWSVKVYLDETPGRSPGAFPPCAVRASSEGAAYLAARHAQGIRRREIQATVRQELAAVADALQRLADDWRQLRPLPRDLLGRPQKMVWYAACLLARHGEPGFQAACGRLRGALAGQRLDLEVTGPWPAYHFCPSLDAEGDCVATPTAGHQS
jgi:hypothetical protein